MAVLIACAIAAFRRQEDAQLFSRRISPNAIRHACAILTIYLTLFLSAALVISRAEGLPLVTCLFETASAIGTVGLTLGVTPSLGLFSQAILITLMFLGRIGGLTLLLTFFAGNRVRMGHLPEERITIG